MYGIYSMYEVFLMHDMFFDRCVLPWLPAPIAPLVRRRVRIGCGALELAAHSTVPVRLLVESDAAEAAAPAHRLGTRPWGRWGQRRARLRLGLSLIHI